MWSVPRGTRAKVGIGYLRIRCKSTLLAHPRRTLGLAALGKDWGGIVHVDIKGTYCQVVSPRMGLAGVIGKIF